MSVCYFFDHDATSTLRSIVLLRMISYKILSFDHTSFFHSFCAELEEIPGPTYHIVE